MADVKTNLDDNIAKVTEKVLKASLKDMEMTNKFDGLFMSLSDLKNPEQTTLVGQYIQWLIKEKAGGDAAALWIPGASKAHDFNAKYENYVGEFIQTFTNGVKLERTTEHVLVGMLKDEGKFRDGIGSITEEQYKILQANDKSNPKWQQVEKHHAMYQQLCNEMKIAPDFEVFQSIMKGRFAEVQNAGGMKDPDVERQARYAQFVIESPIKRASFNWNGVSTDKGDMENDLEILQELKTEADKLATFPLESEDGVTKYTNLTSEQVEERTQALHYYNSARLNYMQREMQNMGLGDKVELVEGLLNMSTITGITRSSVEAHLRNKYAQDKSIQPGDIDALVKAAMGGDLTPGLVADIGIDKKAIKMLKIRYGKDLDLSQLPPMTEIGMQAQREMIRTSAENYFIRNTEAASNLETDKKFLETTLISRAIDESKLDTSRGETKESITQDLLKDIEAIGKSQIPDLIFSMTRASTVWGKDEEKEDKDGRKLEYLLPGDRSRAQLMFSLFTSGSFDQQIIGIEERLQTKYKGKVQFNKAVGDGSKRDGTVRTQMTKLYMHYAKQHTNAYMRNVKDESKVKSNKKYRQAAGDLFDTKMVEDCTGEKIETTEKPSKRYHKSVSKPPYRALANNMKMINQLAAMMCKSFQKTIGAGGFYSQMSQEDFNKMIGFGQGLDKRTNDLHGFFFNELVDVDEKGNPKPVLDTNGNIVPPNQMVAGLVMEGKDIDKRFVKMCEHLAIRSDKMDFIEFIKDGDPRRVEEALKLVPELNQEFEKWVENNGQQAIEDAKNEKDRQDRELLEIIKEDLGKDDERVKTHNKLLALGKEEEAKAIFKNDIEVLRKEHYGKEEDSGTAPAETKQGDLATMIGRNKMFNNLEVTRLKKLVSPESKYSLSDVEKAAASEDIEYLETMNEVLSNMPKDTPAEQMKQLAAIMYRDRVLAKAKAKAEADKNYELTAEEKRVMDMAENNVVQLGKPASYKGGGQWVNKNNEDSKDNPPWASMTGDFTDEQMEARIKEYNIARKQDQDKHK